MYTYKDEGHGIGGNEPSVDCTMNIAFWFDEHLQSCTE